MLNTIFEPSRIKLDLESATKAEVFEELIETIIASNEKYDRRKLLEAVTVRESKMTTIIMPGVAMPHGCCASINGIIGAAGFSRAGIEYDDENQNPVHLLFMLIMDEASREQHLRALSRLLKMLKSSAFTEIYEKGTPEHLYGLLCRY